MKFYIKHMFSFRCRIVVEEILKEMQLKYSAVDFGFVELTDNISLQQRQEFKAKLQGSGLDLLDDKRNILIERIKNVIINLIHHPDMLPRVNCCEYISHQLGYDYTYLANVFSEVKGITIKQFIINLKIERVKELLLYEDYTLKEISYQLNYSSVAHLSNQFKKTTGLTPSYYRQTFNLNLCESN
ncbi:MAG: AraC family transcriptional regulator [Candidatus Pedobacter colombiensis]|uniref:AraC family transcriptional regulator n=1 Tax=Candidatus Pedobacter colombiensis TaxID=3121371 RepID=A0AAJ6B910_9SPHI|nr:AraC family transcriptional regulator [Pedobacter sp.]WEK21439.1 MAG: AraC family transcriptional regulator [Pedobacter sp.]